MSNCGPVSKCRIAVNESIGAFCSSLSPKASLGRASQRMASRSVENTPWLNTLQCWFFAIMSIRETLATNLKKLRRNAGLSQEELAHRAQIDRTYISSIERCQYAASIDVLERLARELGVKPAELLEESARD